MCKNSEQVLLLFQIYKSVQLIHVSFDNIFLMFKIKFRVPGSFICKRIVIILMFKIKCINACALITDYAKNILKTHINSKATSLNQWVNKTSYGIINNRITIVLLLNWENHCMKYLLEKYV